jgi:hypothetical protein
MKKMTDEEIRKKDMAYAELQNNAPEDDFENGMRECRDFYDAQIDAQEKTMEELWNIYNNIDLNKEAYTYAVNHDFLVGMSTKFAIAVAFFLAAGGRIKE